MLSSFPAGAEPCALPAFPPPRPLSGASVARTHVSAPKPPTWQASGTVATQLTAPPGPLAKARSAVTAPAPAARATCSASTACNACCTARGSRPSSCTTQCRAPWAAAAAAASVNLALAASISALAAPFCLFLRPLLRASSLPRHPSLSTAETGATSKHLPSSRTSASSGDFLASSSARRPARRSPSALAARAAEPVAATIRRTPFAIAFSSSTTNANASAVFAMWVPPQNSTDCDPQRRSRGDASNSSTAVAPTVTTRTGSG
mmetsp:Transcript_35807/g.113860  ORF Transcript_35807/g.113860 Transcript_35807/m.113860 type:complete len:263 (-) Transcript_35807:502-1290(-)